MSASMNRRDLAALARTVGTLCEWQAATNKRIELLERLFMSDSEPLPQFVPVSEIAKMCDVSERTIWRVLRNNKSIATKYIGGSRRIDPRSFARAMPSMVLKFAPADVDPGPQSHHGEHRERKAA
jgi:hypothetical protein